MRFKSKGYTDEQIEAVVGTPRFQRMKEDMELTFIESHFGMKDKWFYTMLAVIVIGTVVFGIVISC